MSWIISSDLAAVQLAATLTRLNAGDNPSSIRLYSSARPTEAVDPGDHMAEILLAKPAGTIVARVLKLVPAAGSSPMVLSTGIPRWALLCAGDGTPLANGKVTDKYGGGEIRIEGGVTPEGEDSPQLYAGGRVLLLETFLT